MSIQSLLTAVNNISLEPKEIDDLIYKYFGAVIRAKQRKLCYTPKFTESKIKKLRELCDKFSSLRNNPLSDNFKDAVDIIKYE